MNESLIAYLEDTVYFDGEHLYWRIISGRRKPGPIGNITDKGYIAFSVTYENRRYRLMAHRVIWALHHKKWPLMVDHIDGNKTNNSLNNLREVNNSQNCRNKLGNKNSKVKWKGVTYHKRDKTYDAVIGVTGKNTYLGRFLEPMEAALAYNYAAEKMFGEYAKFNQVFVDMPQEVLDVEV